VTLIRLLRAATERLFAAGIEDASLEAEVLLRHVLGITKTEFYLRFDAAVSHTDETAFELVLQRRISGEPTAYITGHREFFGLDFKVDRRVLIPRPESELLVERAILLGNGGARTFADVGTGSGCIAISIAYALSGATVYAIDVSTDALEVAQMNCERHGVEDRVILLNGDLLSPMSRRVDVIIGNLPYVKRSDVVGINTNGYEPRLALDGGPDGLDIMRRLSSQAASKLNPGGALLVELGQGQAEEACRIIRGDLDCDNCEVVKDLAGIERMLVVKLKRD
jgi:release factor glutamine methyltransferase